MESTGWVLFLGAGLCLSAALLGTKDAWRTVESRLADCLYRMEDLEAIYLNSDTQHRYSLLPRDQDEGASIRYWEGRREEGRNPLSLNGHGRYYHRTN